MNDIKKERYKTRNYSVKHIKEWWILPTSWCVTDSRSTNPTWMHFQHVCM